MNKILRIFRKEMMETLRDRRTIMAMIVMPLLAFPLIINLVVRVQTGLTRSEAERTLTVGLVDHGQAPEFGAMLGAAGTEAGGYKVVNFNDEVAKSDSLNAKLLHLVREDSLDAAVIFPTDFSQTQGRHGTSEVLMYYKGSELVTASRMEAIFSIYKEQLLEARLDSLELSRASITPVTVDQQDASEQRETFGRLAGGMLPYFFLAFAFLGCLYPAIDLFSGEKERGTMETILTTPVMRSQILLGKLGVVVVSGLLSASLALIGLIFSISSFGSEGGLLSQIQAIMGPQFIASIYVLFIPVSIFFAGLMVSISVYARTFKEAQSIITPLNMVLVVPAVAGFIPGLKLTVVTALIPIVNVVLATKDLIAGNADVGLIALTFVSLCALAAVAVAFAFRRFGDERNVLRT